MKFNLARQVRRPSKRPIDLPPIHTTKAQADDLAVLYARITAHWQEAVPHIVTAYGHALAQKLRTDSVEQTGSIIDVAGDAIQRLLVVLTPDLRRWALRVESWHRGKFIRGVLSGAGVDLGTQIGPLDAQDTVEAVVQRNVALVRDVSEEIRSRIADAVFRGYQQRTPAVALGKEINEAVSLGRARSNRIAGDQVVKLSSALDAERQRQAGLDVWKWRWSHKRHGRPAHIARDGHLYSDDEAWVGKESGGIEIGEPPQDLPGVLPFCGCVRQGVIVFADDS